MTATSETVLDLRREDHVADLLMDGKKLIEVANETNMSVIEVARIARERHILEGEQPGKNGGTDEDETKPLFETDNPTPPEKKKHAVQKYSYAVKAVVDFLRRNPGSYSRMRMKAIVRKECPEIQAPGRVLNVLVAGGYIVQDPEKGYKAYIPSWSLAGAPETKAAGAGTVPTQGSGESVVCPDRACGKVIQGRSPGSKIKTLYWNHLLRGPHKGLQYRQRTDLMKRAFLDYRPMWAGGRTTDRVRVTEKPATEDASAVICPACEKEVMALLARAGLKPRSEITGFRITVEGVGK